MIDPVSRDDLDIPFVNALLQAGGRWPHAEVAASRPERIGVEYGLSGRCYRLHVSLTSGPATTLIAKFEGADSIARAVAFRERNEAILGNRIPAMYGAHVDAGADRGLILMEDISPAGQGDDLTGCTRRQGLSIVELIAELHARTWLPRDTRPDLPSRKWARRDWEPGVWTDRLTRAALRYPEQFGDETMVRLSLIPDEAAAAHDALTRGARSWVHHDPHPDNVLWRRDGRIVLLDWSGASIAPPGIDVARLLMSLSFRDDAPLSPTELLDAYTAVLHDHGVEVASEEIAHSAGLAVRLLVRGIVGWAGLDANPPPDGRALALRDDSPRRVRAALRWLDE